MTTGTASLRIIRGKECDRLTGTHASQRYRLEAAGQFPRRVKISEKAVGWIEGEVVAWVKGRMALRDEIEAYEGSLPPGTRHRLRSSRARVRRRARPLRVPQVNLNFEIVLTPEPRREGWCQSHTAGRDDRTRLRTALRSGP